MLKHLQMHYFPVNKHYGTEASLKKSHTCRIMSLTLQKLNQIRKKVKEKEEILENSNYYDLQMLKGLHSIR